MKKIDRTNAVLAGLVFLVSFVVYALTVQRSFSFWDCGEFIACAHILGVPHPPGTPLFVLLGKVFSLIPFVEDISHRINYLSVLSSSFTAMFAYLLIVRLVGHLYEAGDRLNRLVAYMSGLIGAFFVAFSATNWGNSVETEVYGPSLALMVAMVWLAIRYWEIRGTRRATQLMVLVMYMAIAGIGIHMTVFLITPVIAVFFVLNKNAGVRDWALLSGAIILEILLIMLFADGRGGAPVFSAVTALIAIGLLVMLYRKLNWGELIANGSLSTVMLSFSKFIWIVPIGLVAIIAMAVLSKSTGLNIRWRSALAILIVGIIGISSHIYIPIRSSLNPRIDENNPSRDYQTFVNYLDRKQYGQGSMVERMFERRGEWSNQFGRHVHMGFWSYFEEQYSYGGWGFVPFLLLGLIGLFVAVRKRLELGLPFLALFIFCSVGLVLYMNFADGTQYSPQNNAYLEVRNRDYFFTPAFVFFGIAMGLGVSGIVQLLREKLAAGNDNLQKMIVYASAALFIMPGLTLAKNYHINDRSDNYLPLNYAKNILDTCEENAIVFTSGDNDTFPTWCLQEVYEYRKDVRVVCLSLLNTDWYVEQMKNRYDVPISLTDEQILWDPFEFRPGLWGSRPKVMFHDRPRRTRAYMQGYMHDGKSVRVQDMIVDDIIIENKWAVPIYFSGAPYDSSPLKLRDFAVANGILYRLDREPVESRIDLDRCFDLFMNTYSFRGMESSAVYRDDNATGIHQAIGARVVQVYDSFLSSGDTTRARQLIEKIQQDYAEYWQVYLIQTEYYDNQGDSAQSLALVNQIHDTLTAFLASNEGNLMYRQDLGMVKLDLGKRLGDSVLVEEGLQLVWDGFMGDQNNAYAFRKLTTAMIQHNRIADINKAAQMFTRYKINLQDPYLQRLFGQSSAAPPPVGQ